LPSAQAADARFRKLTHPTDIPLSEAKDWFDVLPAAMGVEGLVVKGASTRYTPGRRDAWVKVNSAGVRCVRFTNLPGVMEVSALFDVCPSCATGVADGTLQPTSDSRRSCRRVRSAGTG
jgi:hypothetical protein